jgi:hypothetical protein
MTDRDIVQIVVLETASVAVTCDDGRERNVVCWALLSGSNVVEPMVMTPYARLVLALEYSEHC